MRLTDTSKNYEKSVSLRFIRILKIESTDRIDLELTSYHQIRCRHSSKTNALKLLCISNDHRNSISIPRHRVFLHYTKEVFCRDPNSRSTRLHLANSFLVVLEVSLHIKATPAPHVSCKESNLESVSRKYIKSREDTFVVRQRSKRIPALLLRVSKR